MQPLIGWLAALRVTYSGPQALDGYTSLRPWIVATFADQATADAVWIAVGLVTLIILCTAAARDRTQTLAIPGLLCLWSLPHDLSQREQSDPDVAGVRVSAHAGRCRYACTRWWAIGIMQAALIAGPAGSIPRRARRALGDDDGELRPGARAGNVCHRAVVVAAATTLPGPSRLPGRGSGEAGAEGTNQRYACQRPEARTTHQRDDSFTGRRSWPARRFPPAPSCSPSETLAS